MDTLTTSCTPTLVITANGEVETHQEATVYVRELEIFLTLKVLENTPAVLSLGKVAMKTDILTSGSTVKNQISLKTVFEYNVTRRTSFRSWFQACQQVLHPVLIAKTPSMKRNHPTSSSSSSSSPTTTVSSDSETREREDLSGIDSPPVPVSSSHVERIE